MRRPLQDEDMLTAPLPAVRRGELIGIALAGALMGILTACALFIGLVAGLAVSTIQAALALFQ